MKITGDKKFCVFGLATLLVLFFSLSTALAAENTAPKSLSDQQLEAEALRVMKLSDVDRRAAV